MTVAYLGSMNLAAALPAADVAAAAGVDGIGAAFPDLAGRLTALHAQIVALATMPPLPSFDDMFTQANDLVASISLAINTPGLPPPPSIATTIAALQAFVVELEAMVTALHAHMQIIVGFQTLLGTAGVHVLAFDGAIGALGSELQAAIAGPIPSGHANAIALVTTSGATWTAMSQIFKVSL